VGQTPRHLAGQRTLPRVEQGPESESSESRALAVKMDPTLTLISHVASINRYVVPLIITFASLIGHGAV
jgi:hypothetical protein